MTLADEIARDIEAVAADADRIQALSSTRPHIFAEQKDEVARRLKRIATRVRNGFGGIPGRIDAGTIVGPKNRPVRVERRRSA